MVRDIIVDKRRKILVMKIEILLIAALLIFGVACASQGKATAEMKSVDYQTFAKKIKSGDVPIIDVRTPEEYAAGHIPGAINIDASAEGFEQEICQFDKSKPLAIYCRSGRRSKEAAERIMSKGYDVIELDKGIRSWEGEIEIPAEQSIRVE